MLTSARTLYYARLDDTGWLNSEENLIAPGIIDPDEVFLFFKGNLIGKQAFFDCQQAFTRRNSEHVALQTGTVGGCGFRSE